MRKITELAASAFHSGVDFSQSNTTVRNDIHGNTVLSLHGHTIAIKYNDGSIFVNDAGWQTNTTKERINGIIDTTLNSVISRVYQRDYTWYVDTDSETRVVFGSRGEWVKVN